MFPAPSAVLASLQAVWNVFLVLRGVVVLSLAFGASERDKFLRHEKMISPISMMISPINLRNRL